MSNGFGQSPKKQTVYSGPTPNLGQGTVYSGPTIQSREGTVYDGPAMPPRGGVAYNGPDSGGATPTLSQIIAAKAASASAGHAQKTGNVFFLIAGLSLLNTFLAMSGTPVALALGLGITRMFDAVLRQGGSIGPVLVLNALVASVFVLIGVFARQGKGAAILIGLLLYAGDTVLLALDGVGLHIPSLVIHAIFLVSMFRSYRMVQG